MTSDVFPPIFPDKKGFYPESIYWEAIERYPTVAELVSKKAEENQDKVWLEFQDGRTFTYREADHVSDCLAAGFHRQGIREEDRAAIFGLNSPEWILSYFGLLKIGAVPVTVNTGFVKDPLVYNFRASDARYAIIDHRLMERFKDVEDQLGFIEHVFVIGKDQFDEQQVPSMPYSYIENLFENPPDPGLRATRYPKDPCTMILTSGTTGPSKVVADTNAQFISTALFLIDAGGITPKSVIYTYLPLFHIMALDMATILSMLANAKIVLVESFNPNIFWEHIHQYQATHFHAVGPILEMLFKQPESDLEKNHGPITAVAYCSKEIWMHAKERFNISLTGGYGSTEVGIPVSAPYDISSKGENLPGACGLIGPHVEVAIMDETGHFLPSNQSGEILVRPKIPWATFLEYYKMPEATAEAFKGLWFHTGDSGYFDEKGFLHFVDRLKDAIRRKGENISSYEVEQVLMKQPGIQETIVIPAPSEVGEDEVMAVVVPDQDSGLTYEEVIRYCKENMPHFWVPRYVRFVESLPRTQTGRIQKFTYREEGVTSDTYDRKA
jgi:crotonobetaine/carnitine-CoA ligase